MATPTPSILISEESREAAAGVNPDVAILGCCSFAAADGLLLGMGGASIAASSNAFTSSAYNNYHHINTMFHNIYTHLNYKHN